MKLYFPHILINFCPSKLRKQCTCQTKCLHKNGMTSTWYYHTMLFKWSFQVMACFEENGRTFSFKTIEYIFNIAKHWINSTMSIIVHMLTRKFILTSALRGSILSNFLNSIIAMPCDACNLGTNYMKMWVKGIEENAPSIFSKRLRSFEIKCEFKSLKKCNFNEKSLH